MKFDVTFAINSFPSILSAVPISILLAVLSTIFGIILGFFIAQFRIYKISILNEISGFYVIFFRGVPIIILLYIIYYCLPYEISQIFPQQNFATLLGNISPFVYALITFTLYSSAYSSEMIRSALLSVNAGQIEAAYSVGLNKSQAFWRIIIPQALVVALPNIGNNFLELVKDTSIASFIGVMEIMNQAKADASIGYNSLEAYTVAAIIYWGVSSLFERLLILGERKTRHNRKH